MFNIVGRSIDRLYVDFEWDNVSVSMRWDAENLEAIKENLEYALEEIRIKLHELK